MKIGAKIKQICQWAAIGSIVVFFIFCAIKASHLRHLSAVRVLATNQLAVATADQSAAARNKPKVKPLIKPKLEFPDSMPQPDAHIMALARDLQGNIWIGTEDNGVFRYDPSADPGRQWSQFTTNSGLGDNSAYAIACDKQGRIWVGELNHGVAVFDGDNWKNYDIIDGPIGERIFRIAVCPTDGDVWMATSAGLTRYSPDLNTWRYYTRADGLPSDQASSLAFDLKGNLYVGTQCDGIAVGSAASGYKQWNIIPGPAQLPTTPLGAGLPSGLINDLLVARDQIVYAATTSGLAFSTNSGKAWQYIRGWDYAAKVRGFAGDAPPDDWQPVSKVNLRDLLLPEDYITCLSEDKDTNIWLGFRMQGYAVLSPKADKILHRDTRMGGWLNDNYVTAMLPGDDFKGYAGTYGGGLAMAEKSTNSDEAYNGDQTNSASPALTTIELPIPARPPTLAELNLALNEVNSITGGPKETNPIVIPMEDDWKTEGEWIGRYGRFWIVLCGNCSPKDDLWGAGWDVMYDARMGSHHGPNDSLRYWLSAPATADPRILEMSPTYLHSRVLKKLTTWNVNRRQSEWDDHGEIYPRTQDGPHVYCSLSIPAGLFYLSIYNANNDGHGTAERCRDYEVSIRSHPGRTSLDIIDPKHSIMRSFYDLAEFEKRPELARARIKDFWSGVYKRFLVRGPTKLTVQINRNYSFNTIVEAVTLDLVDEMPPPYYLTRQHWEQYELPLFASPETANQKHSPPVSLMSGITEKAVADQLFESLQQLQFKNAGFWAVNKRRYYTMLLRWYLRSGTGRASSEITRTSPLATCYYQLGLYSQWEQNLEQLGIMPTREIEKNLRWDGYTYSYAGKGYEIVTKYILKHAVEFDPVKSLSTNYSNMIDPQGNARPENIK